MTVETTSPALRPPLAWAALLGIGIAWGATSPLSKLAVSTGNHPVGITFWNTLIGAAILTGVQLARRRGIPCDRRHLMFYAVCGFLGTALPHSLGFEALRHLPVGVNVILIALVPMLTLILALPLGLEQAEPRRIEGLVLGAVAVALIVLPETSLPDPEQVAWVALPLIVACAYAGESLWLAAARPPGCDSLTTLCGLSWAALVMLVPAMLAMDAAVDIARMGPPEQAIFGMTVLHVVAYAGFVWLIGRAGAVFATQVGYVVTGSGVLFGIVFFGERPSPWLWTALALMMGGLALVKPRE